MSRPKAFNPDEALEKAMQVFWHKGYEATSMEDLLSAMDINRGSLYATFGDKRELFLKAMDLYCTGGGVGSRLSILSQTGPALPLIRQFIGAMLEFGLSDPLRRGCMMTNTLVELAPHEKDIALKGRDGCRWRKRASSSCFCARSRKENLRHTKTRAHWPGSWSR